MDIWGADKLVIFIAFVIPGFISMKTFSLLVPSTRKDPIKLLDAIAFSCINYGMLSWLLLLDFHFKWGETYPLVHLGLVVLCIFVFPVLWSITVVWLRKKDSIKKNNTPPDS